METTQADEWIKKRKYVFIHTFAHTHSHTHRNITQPQKEENLTVCSMDGP